MDEETCEQKNDRKLALFAELGSHIGPIVERETLVNLNRTTDCVDCLLAHVVEILAVYYQLDAEVAQQCFKAMRSQVQREIQKQCGDGLAKGPIIEP